MDKLTYFIESSKEEKYRFSAWVFNAFTRMAPINLSEVDTATVKHLDLFTGLDEQHYYWDEDKRAFTKILESKAGEPLYNAKERLNLEAGMFGAKGALDTTYGILLANLILIFYPFKGKIPFVNKRFKASHIEDLMSQLMHDNPDPEKGEVEDPTKVYVKDYLRFTQAAMYLSNFTQIWIPGDTEKSIQTHPDMAKRKAELLEDPRFKDKLHDQAVLAEFEAELLKLDAEHLAGDDSLGLYNNDKSLKVVRKKLYVTMGHEQGFSDSSEANPIIPSLTEGWDLERFPDYNDTLRAGTHDRGSQTSKGGDLVKWLIRASNTVNIVEGDCGTTLGRRTVVTEANKKRLIGFSYVARSGKAIEITEENFASLIGKRIVVRSMMYCALTETERCYVCAGKRLASNPTGASSGVTSMGDIIMSSFMKSMHGTVLSTAHYDPKRLFT